MKVAEGPIVFVDGMRADARKSSVDTAFVRSADAEQILPASGLTHCNACRFWEHGVVEGACRRHAPGTSDRSYEIARWPETRALDACGEGETADASEKGQVCRSCAFWHRPGNGIDPPRRSDRLGTWWTEAGFCRRYAPRPGADIGTHAFWRATNAADHCFDGRPA